MLGGGNRTTVVTGPLGERVEAEWRLDGELAVIETARASGLTLAGGREGNDPLRASTTGSGELIDAAIHAARPASSSASAVRPPRTEVWEPSTRLGWVSFATRGVAVEVACDVDTRFLDAAPLFGPQKGATDAQIGTLTDRLRRLAGRYHEQLGVDVTALPHAGASGGLAGGLAALGAELLPGFDLIADAIGLDEALDGAQLVVTGEGRLDTTSFSGKVVGGVARHALGTSGAGCRHLR